MKANVDTKVRTLVEVRNQARSFPIPAGVEGYVVQTYTEPREGYDIEVQLADDDFEVVTLHPDQFEVITPGA